MHAKLLQSCPTLFDPIDGSPRLLCLWDSPDKNAGVDCHALLLGIFLTQGSNPCLLYLLQWEVGSLPLDHVGSPRYGRVSQNQICAPERLTEQPLAKVIKVKNGRWESQGKQFTKSVANDKTSDFKQKLEFWKICIHYMCQTSSQYLKILLILSVLILSNVFFFK